MKVLTPSQLIRIGVGLGLLEIIVLGSGYLHHIPLFYFIGKDTEWQLVMKLEQCEGKYPTVVLVFSQIYFLFCAMSCYKWVFVRAQKPIRVVNKRLMLAGYAITPVLIMIPCYYELHSKLCSQSGSNDGIFSHRAGILSMPLILNGMAAVLGFFVSMVLYALINRRHLEQIMDNAP